jgi:hypothetical protein
METRQITKLEMPDPITLEGLEKLERDITQLPAEYCSNEVVELYSLVLALKWKKFGTI